MDGAQRFLHTANERHGIAQRFEVRYEIEGIHWFIATQTQWAALRLPILWKLSLA